MATPVLLVLVSAGQVSTRLDGTISEGGVLSRMVIVWRALALLLQASIAIQVRAMIFVPPQLVLTTSLQEIRTLLHPSDAVATPVTFVRTSPGHSWVRLVGGVIEGAVLSRTAMVCTRLVLLP